MKTVKILMLVVMAGTVLSTARAGNDKPVAFAQLPARTQEFIRHYFSPDHISYAVMDQELFDRSYDVFFVDGSKAEFDRHGDWETVDCRSRKIPAGIVPVELERFVSRNHPGRFIVKIDRDRRDYEIELDNELEIKFDLKFNVIEYDD